MEELWPAGYREQFETSMANARWLANELTDQGFDVVDPVLPLVAASVPTELFAELRESGWRISRTADGKLRVVCMPHVTREMLDSFVTDIDRLQ